MTKSQQDSKMNAMEYIIISAATLIFGSLVSYALNGDFSGSVNPFISLIFLLAFYIIFHAIFIILAFLLKKLMKNPSLSVAYLVISVIFLFLSLIFFGANTSTGIHFFVIFAANLCLLSYYNLILVTRKARE